MNFKDQIYSLGGQTNFACQLRKTKDKHVLFIVHGKGLKKHSQMVQYIFMTNYPLI